MGAVLILYGSRARGEADIESDVDLIFADEGDDIGIPSVTFGVSVHRYSKGWLLKQAREGTLFVYHVAFEGIALCDRDDFLSKLQQDFKKKPSYLEERREALLILRMLLESDWQSNQEIQKRYFWAIRTILISLSADSGDPSFSSACLEKLSEIDGLAAHIRKRTVETYSNCLAMGRRIEKRFGAGIDPSLSGARLHNYLANRGGIAQDTVHLVEHHDLSNAGVSLTYL